MKTCTRVTQFFLLFYCLSFGCVPTWGQLTDTTKVTIQDLGDVIEMQNGFLGVRLPKASLFDPALPDRVPAPVRTVVYRDGSLGNPIPNYLRSPTPALTMSTEVLYQTTDSCTVRVSYTFEKPELNNNGNTLEPAGPGYYRVTVRMVNGERGCLVEEESDFEVGWEMPVSNGLSPDRGRYLGHHSTSVADGYDVNGNIYEKKDRRGWHATTDLAFAQRKDYPMMARWEPWVVNSGWEWQLYNDDAAPEANTFGIFAGRASKLLGAAFSGTSIFTEPAGASDLHADCDLGGNCHYVWRSQNEIWYKKVNSNGNLEVEQLIATGLESPFVFAEGNTVNILALDPLAAAGNKLKMLRKTGAAAWQTSTLALDATLDDPYLYGASNGTTDFVLLEGTHNGQHGLLLYSAPAGTNNFTYADVLEVADAFRSGNRPDMKKLANGDILVGYASGGYNQSYRFILNGSTTFAPAANEPFGTATTFGMAVDTRSGKLFWVGPNGDANLASFNGTAVAGVVSAQVAATVNHGAFGLPNRRSIASDGAGNSLAFHEGQFYHFAAASQTWTKLTSTGWNGLSPAHVHFNPTSQQFFIFGRKHGQLAWHSTFGTTTPVELQSFPNTQRPNAGIQVSHNRVTPANTYYPDIRYEWGIFAGRQNEMPAADEVQPIQLTMNRLSGLANKLDRYENDPADFSPEFFNGGLYISPDEAQALIHRVREDEGFYDEMVTIDNGFKVVMDAWRDGSGAKTTEAYNQLVAYAEGVEEALRNGDGIYDFYYQYITGGNELRRNGTLMVALLADGKLSQQQRETLEGKAALFARIMWDDDFVPFFTGHGLNLGTANMPPAFRAYRWFFALLLTPDDEFADRANAVKNELNHELKINLNASGAPLGTPHYLQPTMDNLLFPALQLRNQGISDVFAENDTLRLFADFVLHLQGPESVRFGGGNRKLICFGDGTEESAAIFGLLATGFADIDEVLSQRLMYAFRHGPPRASDFGFVTFALDHNLPDNDRIVYGSGNFPGYLSTFRFAEGTPEETAAWFINGDWYFDHRNDDRGALAIYALGAPLALSSGSFYSPYVQGGHMKNIVLPETQFFEWNQDQQPFILPEAESWTQSQNQQFLAFEHSISSSAFFTKNSNGWGREVFMFTPRESTPVFVIKDTLTNGLAWYLWNMNFVSDGPVVTPAGNFDPLSRKWAYQNGPYEQPGAAGEIGLWVTGFHRFQFTGQNWSVHPTGGIDWDLYVGADNEQSSSLSEWAHTFIPTVEANEFQATNGVPFEERYQMLRIKGNEGYFVVLVPYGKGQRPNNLDVQRDGDIVIVTADEFEFHTDLTFYTFHDDNRDVLTSYDGQLVEFADASIEGGPAELEISGNVIFARLHGSTGTRFVKLPPGDWEISRPSPDAVFNAASGKWELSYTDQGALVNSYSGGYKEFLFTKKVRVSPKLLLEGAWDGSAGLMRDVLRTENLLPQTEPFTDLEFRHRIGGDETVEGAGLATTGPDAIVDWLYLELRSATDPAQVLSTRSALLQRDGDVVEVDGVSPLEFYGTLPGEYYLAVRHRNHLPVMTAQPVMLGETSLAIDFTLSATQIWSENGRKDLGSGRLALFSGDLDETRHVDAGDRMTAWNRQRQGRYHLADANLDGNVDNLDKLLTWANRNVSVALP